MKNILFSIIALVATAAISADKVPISITSVASGTGSSALSDLRVDGFLEGVQIKCANSTNGAVDVDLVLRTDPDAGISSGITMLDIEGVGATATYYTIRKTNINYLGAVNQTNNTERYYIPDCKVQLLATNPTLPSVDVEVRLIVTKE